VRDRRYSTAAWQKLRRQVLAYAGGVCQVQGPRCTGASTTVDHIVPVLQWPEGFWEPENLRAACRRCNYGGGARVAAENTRRTIEHLRALGEEQQQQQIAEMAERLARYEHPKRPAIY
jgi:5-methylcytosine-specific restriction endonuclease McrA